MILPPTVESVGDVATCPNTGAKGIVYAVDLIDGVAYVRITWHTTH